jgi:hypothetical protein
MAGKASATATATSRVKRVVFFLAHRLGCIVPVRVVIDLILFHPPPDVKGCAQARGRVSASSPANARRPGRAVQGPH